jgi:hypothetical protein
LIKANQKVVKTFQIVSLSPWRRRRDRRSVSDESRF